MNENQAVGMGSGCQPQLIEGLNYTKRLISEQQELIGLIQDRVMALRDLRSPTKESVSNAPSRVPEGFVDNLIESNEALSRNVDKLRDIHSQLSQLI